MEQNSKIAAKWEEEGIKVKWNLIVWCVVLMFVVRLANVNYCF